MRTILKPLAMLACALFVGGGCADAPRRGGAPEAPADSQTQLEAIFWACDYVATTKGMDATPVAQCAAATRELRRVKFANSFNAMLAWWRENKSAEHDRVRRSREDQPL